MPNALILTKHPDEYRRLVEAAALPDLHLTATADVAEGLASAADSEILFGDPTRVKSALPGMRNLRWAQLTWAGVEPMLDPALRRDYVLTNIRGVFGPLMSEYVFSYLLAHERRILSRYESQRAGQWDATLPGSLQGKTIGLVGVGSIGAHLARTAKHFAMTVHGYTRSSAECADVDRYFHGADKAAFASGLDYLVAVLPNTAATRRVVDAEMLEALPAHAVLVNGGRGDTIDETALLASLAGNRLAGAVLDVFPEEPLPAAHPFWREPKILITGHTAAPSFPRDIVRVFVENYRRYAAGEPLQHRVDFERGY